MVYRLIVGLTQPYTLLFLLAGLALISLWHRHRESRRRQLLVVLPFDALWLISMPVTSYLALGTLEWGYPPIDRPPAEAEAIVVLSGSLAEPDSVRHRAMLGESSLHRCLHAAELYRVGPSRLVLATGGQSDPTPGGVPCAEAMKELLVQLGVKPADLLVETTSRTTYENAFNSRRKLDQRGIHRILLVTEATHMPRAVRCFRAQGFDVIPAACGHRATKLDPGLHLLLPSPNAAQEVLTVSHEWFGLIWYKLRGWI